MEHKIRPYRIKHKPTGLYYQPAANGNNLSKRGKVYLGGKNILSSKDTHVYIKIIPFSWVFIKYGSLFRQSNESHVTPIFKVPKIEFEKEEL